MSTATSSYAPPTPEMYAAAGTLGSVDDFSFLINRHVKHFGSAMTFPPLHSPWLDDIVSQAASYRATGSQLRTANAGANQAWSGLDLLFGTARGIGAETGIGYLPATAIGGYAPLSFTELFDGVAESRGKNYNYGSDNFRKNDPSLVDISPVVGPAREGKYHWNWAKSDWNDGDYLGAASEAITAGANYVQALTDLTGIPALIRSLPKAALKAPKLMRSAKGLPTAVLNVLNKCFVAGTPVLMADGSLKAIEDVEEGDWVLADDPEDGLDPMAREVTAWHLNWTKHLIQVFVDNDGDLTPDGNVQATREHPFWTQNRGWVDAKVLRVGDLLVDASGDFSKVVDAKILNVAEPVFNLSVEGVHTFFVMAGDEPVLVHNTLPGERTYITYQAPDDKGKWYTGRASMPGTLEPDQWEQVLEYRYAGRNPRGLDFTKARRVFFGTGTETAGGPKSAANMASRGWERIAYDAEVLSGTAAKQNIPLKGNSMIDTYLATARRLGMTLCP